MFARHWLCAWYYAFEQKRWWFFSNNRKKRSRAKFPSGRLQVVPVCLGNVVKVLRRKGSGMPVPVLRCLTLRLILAGMQQAAEIPCST